MKKIDTNQKTNDTQALIPFLQDMESHLSFGYRMIVYYQIFLLLKYGIYTYYATESFLTQTV